MSDPDRTLRQLLEVARPIDNGLAWPEVLTSGESETVRQYLTDLYVHGVPDLSNRPAPVAPPSGETSQESTPTSNPAQP